MRTRFRRRIDQAMLAPCRRLQGDATGLHAMSRARGCSWNLHHACFRLDLAPVLAALGYIPYPPPANVFLPTPNHSHVVIAADINIKAIWWQVIPVLVTKPKRLAD